MTLLIYWANRLTKALITTLNGFTLKQKNKKINFINLEKKK